MSAAEILRAARAEAKLTQRELAEKAGMPQPVIARIESGASSPRVDTLDRLLMPCGRRVASARKHNEVDRQDWMQVQDNLRRTPTERLRNLETAARSLTTLRQAARRAGIGALR